MASSNADRDPVELLAEDFLDRRRRGETPSIEEYAQRHPDLAEDLYRLALLHAERGAEPEAVERIVQALDQDELFTMKVLPFLPERQRLALLNRTTRSF